MLHHVSLEVRPEDAERTAELFGAIGFDRVEAPEALGEYVLWLEREGTQVHLIKTPEPAIPQLGHAAFVPPDYGSALAALRAAGFEVADARELWGAQRAFALLPSGGRIELMAMPPPPAG